jgi:hypothetical protein
MRKKIHIHIGYGKTGSSAIQAALARNHDLLEAHGILYPDHSSLPVAKLGQVTSGNLDPEGWFEGQIIETVRRNSAYSTYIFSNENIFHRMDEFLENHGKYAGEYDFEIILFVRNPIERLVSAYQQAVKRRGFAGTIAEFARHDVDTIQAASLVENLAERGIAFKLFNYSAMRNHAVERFFDHLRLWDMIKSGANADVGFVNRSLSRSEFGLILYLNQIFGVQYGSLIADALVNQLPDIATDNIPVDDAVQSDVRRKNARAVEQLNRFLPASEQLELDTIAPPTSSGPHQALSSAQVDVIRKAFPSTLVHADGVTLRDIALKYELGGPLTREDAIAIMEYAQKARPHGQIIAGKLAEWRKS